MNERANFEVERIWSIGATEKGDQVVQRDLELLYKGKVYILSVGTLEYISALKNYNQNIPEEERLDENVLALESVNRLETIIKTLRGMELNSISPYLEEQKEE